MKHISVSVRVTRSLSCLLFSLSSLALAQQAVDKEGWPAYGYTRPVPNSALDNNGYYRAVFQVYRATARTGPSGFVNDQFARAVNFVQSSPIGGREASRREWNDSAEWKSSECGRDSIFLDGGIQANRLWIILIHNFLDV